MVHFLGNRIRKLREDRDLLQRDLAKELNVEKSTVNGYEQNRRVPDLEMLKKIAKYFDVSVDYLIGLTDEKYSDAEYELIKLISLFNSFNQEERKKIINWIERRASGEKGGV